MHSSFSVIIIARDAGQVFAKCLASVKSLTDDILVVVDPRTTDGTETIAKKFGAKIFQRDFDNFAAQKNYAAALAKNDWILSLDADEEIKNFTLPDFSLPVAYGFKRKNIIFGKIINHTNWDPNPILRFYNRKFCSWSGNVHEQLVCNGQISNLSALIIHRNYSSVEQFISKMNHYTSLETKVTNPLYDFLRRYIWHVGFLDGYHGLFLSYLMAIYHLTTWAKKH